MARAYVSILSCHDSFFQIHFVPSTEQRTEEIEQIVQSIPTPPRRSSNSPDILIKFEGKCKEKSRRKEKKWRNIQKYVLSICVISLYKHMRLALHWQVLIPTCGHPCWISWGGGQWGMIGLGYRKQKTNIQSKVCPLAVLVGGSTFISPHSPHFHLDSWWLAFWVPSFHFPPSFGLLLACFLSQSFSKFSWWCGKMQRMCVVHDKYKI